MKNIKKYWKLITMASLLVICALGIYIYRWEYRRPLLEMHFFSLTRGRSIFIRTPQNMTILVGGGQNSEVIREITKITPFYNRKIDMIIIPSATVAQTSGLIEVLDRYEIGKVIMPKIMATSTALTQLLKEIKKKKIHIEEILKGDIVGIEKDLKLDILFPYAGFKFNKTNLPELGLSISYGSTTAYLLGNLSKTVQKDIAKNIEINNPPAGGENMVEFYNSAIKTKVSAELLEKIKPKFTFSTKEKTMHLISDGKVWIHEK